jgi:hypothetical protein
MDGLPPKFELTGSSPKIAQSTAQGRVSQKPRGVLGNSMENN